MTDVSVTTMNKRQTLHILLVEDDPGDVLLVQEVLGEYGYGAHLTIVGDGAEALSYLHREGPYSDAVRPDLILLDLNLPKVSGREVLAQIKNDPALLVVPVIVLTTSSAEEDVLRAYSHRANAYVTKPMDFVQFTAAVSKVGTFFGRTVRLPLN